MLQSHSDEDGAIFLRTVLALRDIVRKKKRPSVPRPGTPSWEEEIHSVQDAQRVKTSTAIVANYLLHVVEMREDFLLSLPNEVPRFSFAVYRGKRRTVVAGGRAPSYEEAKRRAEAVWHTDINARADA